MSWERLSCQVGGVSYLQAATGFFSGMWHPPKSWPTTHSPAEAGHRASPSIPTENRLQCNVRIIASASIRQARTLPDRSSR